MAGAQTAIGKEDPTKLRLRKVWFALDLLWKTVLEEPPESSEWTEAQRAAWRRMWEACAVVVERMEAFRKLSGL